MKTKELLELIKFNKECFELTKDNEFKVNNIRLYRELKFNTTFDKNKKVEVSIKPIKMSCLHFYWKKYESDEIESEYGQEHYKHERELLFN